MSAPGGWLIPPLRRHSGRAIIDNSEYHYPRTNLIVPSAGQDRTQNTVALFEYLIKDYTNPSDLELDSLMGPGTTAFGCITSSRNLIGLERDPDFFRMEKCIVAHGQGKANTL